MSRAACLAMVCFSLLVQGCFLDFSDELMTDCEGGKYDDKSELCWQDPPSSKQMTWSEAKAYCKGLDLGAVGVKIVVA